MDILDKSFRPELEDISQWIHNPIFREFCSELMSVYKCKELIEFSSCSMAKGWNVKFKKAGRSLCTIYPQAGYMTVLVVIGKKEKEAVEAMLPQCSGGLQELYRQTAEGNGQRWLMIDVEDKDELYQEILELIRIRRNA